MPAGKQAGTGDPTREGTTTDRAPERATTRRRRGAAFRFFVSFASGNDAQRFRARALNFPSILEHTEQQLPCITAARLGDGARPRIDRDGDG